MTESSVETTVQSPEIDTDEIDLSGDGGALKRIIREGDPNCGKPGDMCRVALHYTGTLTDGKKFDSSYDRNEPFEFQLGKESVIKAFELGVKSMKKGEKCILTCQPQYAYGATGSGPNIPPNATLIFELELLSWKGEDLSPKSDGGIERFVLEKSESRKSPSDLSFVKIHFIGKYQDRIFEERDVEFHIYEAAEFNIILGLEIALQKFVQGERSKLIIQSKYAFGKAGNKEFNIPPDAEVEYIVTLKEFEKEVAAWTLSEEECMAEASRIKEKGTDYLKKEKYPLAIKMYNLCNTYLTHQKSTTTNRLKIAIFLNKVLCYQKMNDDYKAIKTCHEVLELDPVNIKALYRRGQSYIKCKDMNGALTDFLKVQELEPQNKAAFNQITICRQLIKQYNEKEKKLYANMFTKFATNDKEKDRNHEADVLTSCGEWNMEEEARKEADRALKEFDEHVVML